MEKLNRILPLVCLLAWTSGESAAAAAEDVPAKSLAGCMDQAWHVSWKRNK